MTGVPAAAYPQDKPTKDCPFCGETILEVAIKCKHCGEFLDTAAAPAAAPSVVAGWHWMKTYGGGWFCDEHDSQSCSVCGEAPQRQPSAEELARRPSFKQVLNAKPGGGPGNSPRVTCPHCSVTGGVSVKRIKQKKGISGGKATAAVFTAGLSMFATGLSRKEQVSEARCSNCGVTWVMG